MVVDEAAAIFQALKGQSLIVPSMEPIHGHWVQGISPLYEKLVHTVNQEIDEVVKDRETCKKLQSMDIALFAAYCYPYARWAALKTMAFLVISLCVWDDVLDAEFPPDDPEADSKLEIVGQYRNESVLYITSRLREYDVRKDRSLAPNEGCKIFADYVLDLIRAGEGQVQKEIFREDLQLFIDSSDPEQQQRYTGRLPGLEEFWKVRDGSGAAYANCALHQYMANTCLPNELAMSAEVMAMRLETSKQTCIANDILSLKKEIKAGTSSNLVLITMNETKSSLDDVMDRIVNQMAESAREFDKAADSLRSRASSYGPGVEDQVDRLIAAYEGYQTGVFRWCAVSKRYGIQEYKQEDGSIIIPL